jgi:hypothetical protein
MIVPGPVVIDPSQVDSDWIENALRRAGALDGGGVDDISVEPMGATISQLFRIRLVYRAGSRGSMPSSLVLKLCSIGESFTGSEVDYYVRDYRWLVGPPLLRCYDARFSPTAAAYHLVLDDASATHQNSWNVVPTDEFGQAVAHALATLHAHRWGLQRLANVGATIPSASDVDHYLANIRPGLEPMIQAVVGGIELGWVSSLVELFDRHPTAMIERLRDPTGFTLVHGDVNPGNILSPRAGIGPIYLIDRQPFAWSLTTWLGVSDVAYMMVHWWDSATRRQSEQSVLRAYLDRLTELGVDDYSWEQLWQDYRLCAVQSVYVATEWCVKEEDRQKMRWVWWPQLQKAMTAYEDLKCWETWR